MRPYLPAAPVSATLRAWAAECEPSSAVYRSVARAVALDVNSVSAAAKQKLLPWDCTSPRRCLKCAEAIWSGTQPCCHPETVNALRASLQTTTGLASLVRRNAHCPLMQSVCIEYLTGARDAQPLPLDHWVFIYKHDAVELVRLAARCPQVADLLLDGAHSFRDGHRALSRIATDAPHPSPHLRDVVCARLRKQPDPVRFSRRRPQVWDPWTSVRRALSVKIRLPLWVRDSVDCPALIHRIAGCPPVARVPSKELFAAYGVPFKLDTGWAKSLSKSQRATAHLVVHANRHSRQLSVNWTPTPHTTEVAVICTACVSLCSCHIGVPGKRGVVIDPAANSVRCAKCNRPEVVVVPMGGKTITLSNKDEKIAITACRGCGRLHRLTTGLCGKCDTEEPQTCFCRRVSRLPTVPFVCLVNGQLTKRWVCSRHRPGIPPRPEDLTAIASRLNVQL